RSRLDPRERQCRKTLFSPGKARVSISGESLGYPSVPFANPGPESLSPATCPAVTRGGRDRGAHHVDPLLERQVARDQVCESTRNRSLEAGLFQRLREQRDGLERLDGLAHPGADLLGGH